MQFNKQIEFNACIQILTRGERKMKGHFRAPYISRRARFDSSDDFSGLDTEYWVRNLGNWIELIKADQKADQEKSFFDRRPGSYQNKIKKAENLIRLLNEKNYRAIVTMCREFEEEYEYSPGRHDGPPFEKFVLPIGKKAFGAISRGSGAISKEMEEINSSSAKTDQADIIFNESDLPPKGCIVM